MLTLLLLRHAKSSWKHADLSDHDRPLNQRGQRDAPRVGRFLRQRRLTPGRIMASSATRARRTAEDVAKWSACEGAVQIEPRLYLATPAAVIDVVRQSAGETARVLVVGHNPGMEELARRLTGAREVEPLPTAGLVHVEFELDHWGVLSLSSKGRLVDVWRPRERESAS